MSLTVHFQSKTWADEFVARCRGNLTHIVGVNLGLRYPGVTTLYRTYLPDHEAHALVDRGKDGANEWINKFAPVYREYPDAIFISSNEYLLTNQDRVDRFNAFHVEYIQRMSSLGHRVACGQFNTGWMHLRKYGDPPPYPETIAPVLTALWAHDGILTLHEYWPGLGDPKGNVYRYRDFRAALIAAGIANLPDFFISELGMDLETNDPDSDYGHWGWRKLANNNWPLYFGLLKEYSREMDKDPYMLGASIFTEGGGWESFELGRDNAMELADFIGSETPAPPPPERAKGLYLSKYQETATRETLQALWDDGYRALGFRVTGPNDPDNPTFTEVDKQFLKLYPIARELGFLCYGFHYLHPALDNQARDFGRAVAGKTFELGLWGDVEDGRLTAARCERFFEAADRETGQTVDVYGRTTQLDAWIGDWQQGRRLWLAAWTYDLAKTPTLPKSWKDKGFEWWQWTNKAYLPATLVPDRVCLDAWRGTTEELLDEYGDPGNGGNGGNDVIEIVDITGQPVEGMTWESVQRDYGLSLTEADPPEGATVFRLVRLVYDSTPETNWRLYVLDEEGRPLPGVAAFMGIQPPSGEELPADAAPRLSEEFWGQPEGRPNRALVLQPNSLNFTNLDGFIQHSLGSGSNTVPPRPGSHWAWIMAGEQGVYSDVPAGFGMWDNHLMFWPVFQLQAEDDEDPEPEPGSGYRVTGTITLNLVIEPVEEDG